MTRAVEEVFINGTDVAAYTFVPPADDGWAILTVWLRGVREPIRLEGAIAERARTRLKEFHLEYGGGGQG